MMLSFFRKCFKSRFVFCHYLGQTNSSCNLNRILIVQQLLCSLVQCANFKTRQALGAQGAHVTKISKKIRFIKALPSL